jgi:hypothetical protein
LVVQEIVDVAWDHVYVLLVVSVAVAVVAAVMVLAKEA